MSACDVTRKDFASGQQVRWCPGCGDYAILAAVQTVLADAGADPDRSVFISGIGCSSRFPYYMGTYGMHSIHGRAPTIATGVALANPDLDVWVVTGDGDALSIGGNHLVHALRRNVNLTVVLFNNRIYGLTKGQYSPTSPQGTVSKSSPDGSPDRPLDPVSLALGAGATFVARSIDADRSHLTATLTAARAHRGAALVEVLQNCVVFNDGAFAPVRDRTVQAQHRIELQAGSPVVFGPEDDRRAVVRGRSDRLEVAAAGGADPVVHDPSDDDPTDAFALAQLGRRYPQLTPVGVFRAVDTPAYASVAAAPADVSRRQVDAALAGGASWQV